MDIYEDARMTVADLNREFADEGDPARIRYVSVISDPYWEDGWIVQTFWELPDPGDEPWPLDELRRYEDRIESRFAGRARTMCMFRDPEEIKNPDHRAGQAVPELA